MKVLLLANQDSGGAGRAAYRIHQSLKSVRIDSRMLVARKETGDRSVRGEETRLERLVTRFKLREHLIRMPLARYGAKAQAGFSSQWLPDGLAKKIARENPDIVHLNWIGHGFMRIETIGRLTKPVVWTLADMWPFTGGCYYSQECTRYTDSCGACPQLGSGPERDLSRRVWARKARAWRGLNLTIVTPSTWLADCARASSLFRDLPIEVIPYGLDTTRFHPCDRRAARHALNLPHDKLLVLFGALDATGDSRKGFPLLCPAMKQLSAMGWRDRLELVVFGSSEPEKPADLGGFRAHYLGHVHDDVSLSLVYSAADIMVVPSVQEAFGQTASESFACGTPVVGFARTGVAEIIDHQINGYLAQPYEAGDLANGISWALEDVERHDNLRSSARAKAETAFASDVQGRRYLDLFQRILERGGK